MANFIVFVLILSSVAISSASPTTSTTPTTEASEFKDPRIPTFFEKMFFTGLDMGVNLSEKFLPKVMKNSQYLPKLDKSWTFKCFTHCRHKYYVVLVLCT